jgi:hypothetical protein
MIALIETAEKGVHFSDTMNRPIQIEKIVIERNLKSRREMVLVEEEETTKTVISKTEGFCEWEGCESKGVYVCFIKNNSKLYCERHKEFAKSHGLIMGWKRLEAWRL